MSVVIFSPVKNCGFWLPRFLKNLDSLSDVSRVVFSYGESQDNTLFVLKDWAAKTKHAVEVYADPKMPSASSSAQISKVCEEFQKIMGDEETYALVMDADVMKIPRSLVQQLKKHEKDIVAPYVYIMGREPPQFYDTFVFRVGGYRFHPFNPPKPDKIFEVDSVGSCILITKEAFKKTPFGDPYPIMTFCNNARSLGFKVWADPNIRVEHLDLGRLNRENLPITQDTTPFIQKNGKLSSLADIDEEHRHVSIWGRMP